MTQSVKEYSIDDLEYLIKSIKNSLNITEEEILRRINYNPVYISQARSRGKISGKFIETLKREFKPQLQNSLVVNDPYEYLIKKATRNEAYLRTILMALAEILAAQRNESLIKVLDELTKVVGEEQDQQ